MKILVLGGDGMLGHQLLTSLQNHHEVRVTLRQPELSYRRYNLYNTSNSYFEIDVRDEKDLLKVLSEFRPDAVINAIGIVKQRQSAKEAVPSIEINALFPHQLAQMCERIHSRMIHISTDCVFSGKKGNYLESDYSDAEDLYGRSKYLGEVDYPHCVTLRSSIIGLELSRKTGLIEWFLAQKGTIKGFQKAIYSGLTTQEMSRVIERVLVKNPDLFGVWQVSSAQINKYDLLTSFTKILGRNDIQIEPENDFVCDRSLLSNSFQEKTGYVPPTWDYMLHELADMVKQQQTQNIIMRGVECSV